MPPTGLCKHCIHVVHMQIKHAYTLNKKTVFPLCSKLQQRRYIISDFSINKICTFMNVGYLEKVIFAFFFLCKYLYGLDLFILGNWYLLLV